jgi:hypothetical protein
MRCRHAERWISRSFDRPLDRFRREALEAHLAGCGRCRAAASESLTLRSRLGDVRAPEPLPDFWGRLEARLDEDRVPETQALWVRWSLKAIPASLAMIAGFLGAMAFFVSAPAELGQPETLLFSDENPIVETQSILDEKTGNREIAILFAADERLTGRYRP